ncbi:hypothetical protein C0995_016115 [Termitomyces sp. Mi166|nr:hypothetical protein C0995_016115 [Termitomyces sp. Mi166\
MPMDAILNAVEAIHGSKMTVEIGKFEVGVPDEVIKARIRFLADFDMCAVKEKHHKVECAAEGVIRDKKVKRLQALLGWFKYIKKAIGLRKKRDVSRTVQAKMVKPRRGGMYTFLYGGRVNVDTFYDYRDQSQSH